jgi:hypothetical protein
MPTIDPQPGLFKNRKLNDYVAKNHVIDGADPSNDDDSDDGYSYLSFWLNISGPKLWVCVDPAPTAADWREIKL